MPSVRTSVPSADLADLDDRVPCRNPGGGQRRRLLVAERVGNFDQRRSGHQYLLGEPAVVRDADVMAERRHGERTVDPADEMRTGRPVTDRDPLDPLAHRNDLADPVGHGHARFGAACAIRPTEHQQVAMIEADCAHPKHRFARPCDEVRTLGTAQGTQAILRANLVNLHRLSPSDRPRAKRSDDQAFATATHRPQCGHDGGSVVPTDTLGSPSRFRMALHTRE